MPALHLLGLHQMRQLLPTVQHLGERDPEDAEGGSELAMAMLTADTSVVQSDSQSALCSQHARREQGLRQYQGPAEAERVASEFPNGAQDISSGEQEARNGTHESKDSTDAAGTETAQKCPDRVSGEDTRLTQHSGTWYNTNVIRG